MIRKVLFAALMLLPQCALAKIGGDVDKIPVEPTAQTILVLNQHDQQAQPLLAAFGSTPEFLALRDNTYVQTYDSKDPDFRYRFGKRMPEVTKEGQSALIVERDGQLVYGAAGLSPDEMASQIRDRAVIQTISEQNPSGGAGCIKCLRHPTTTKKEPEEDEDKDILRPILPPRILTPPPAPPHLEPAKTDDNTGLILALALAPVGLVLLGLVGTGTYIAARKVQERNDNN